MYEGVTCVRFEVLTAMRMILFFWVAMSCGLVGGYKCFGEIRHLHLHGEISVYEGLRKARFMVALCLQGSWF